MNRWITKYIHEFIVWYLIKCGCAFHRGKYGLNGVYVTLMSETDYAKFKAMQLKERRTIL